MNNSFKKYSMLIAFVMLSFWGCERLDIEFDINYQTSFTIPSSTGINLPFSLPSRDVTTNSEQEFENNDTKSKWVKSIFLDNLGLTLVNPPNEDFSFLKSVKIFVSTDDLGEVLLASKTDIPNTVGSTLDLEPTPRDLAEYVKAPKLTLRTEVVTDETIFFDITVESDMTFHVLATAPALQ